MKTILVPVDGSRLASAALPVAEEAAREREARVLLLTVGEVAETSTHRAVEEHDLHAIIEAATRELSGVTVVSRIEMSGAPADTILRVAEEEGVDRIIMSTHGGSGMSAWVHGSVAEAVLRHSSIPVTLVRPGGDHEAGQRILLESSDRGRRPPPARWWPWGPACRTKSWSRCGRASRRPTVPTSSRWWRTTWRC